jgi:hypothetical protein
MKRVALLVLTAMIAADDASLVERPAPGQAPTAFRIWAAGENVTDDGTVMFTPKSAAALMAEQEARGRLYPFDFDHLSVLTDRPAESGRAAGWHRLEVRDSANGPELWAVDIEWCADVKAGLEEKPPRWRYFSPAFRIIDGEVTSYINCAVCINPKTHQLPSLASESAAKETTMKEKMLAALATLANAEASEDDKKAALKALGEFFEEDKPKEEPKKDAEPPPAEEKKDEPKKDAEKCAEPAAEEKTETKALASIQRRLTAYDELVERVAKQDNEERTKLLSARIDLTEGMRKELSSKPLDEVKRMLSFLPAPTQKTTRTTQGEHDVDGGTRASRGLQGAALDEYNKLAGKRPVITKTHEIREDGSLQINAITPSEWNRLSKKEGK